jgi:DNA-binding beta-propeller fold protein YncE
MKRLLLALAAAVLLLPGAAEGAACSPLDCAPSQFSLAHGTLLGFRSGADKPVTVVDLQTGHAKWTLPAGIGGGHLLVHQDGAKLVWYDAARGTRLYDATLPSAEYSLGGVSQDGTRAVAFDVSGLSTRATVVSRDGTRTFALPSTRGSWKFDALRGNHLFLIQLLPIGGYEVRLYHLDTSRLDKQPLKDPHESGRIWGSPFSRLASTDGRYLFTLYIGSNGGAMIHELDLKAATARCIDLPGTGDYNSATSWGLALSSNGETLRLVSPGYGRVVSIDVRSRKVTDAFRIALPNWAVVSTTASLSPDGTKLAIANGEAVAVIDLASRRVALRAAAKKTIAVGYSPDGSTLWKLS